MRPSTHFVKLATTFQSEIHVKSGAKTVNGKSILDMVMLAAEYGTPLVIQADGPDAEAAVAALAGLVERKFDMPDDGDDDLV